MVDFDLAIIGGGINGAGIARDAAGRGLRVLLVEQNDLASGASSASTKLIHGGLRDLEHGAFKRVHEAIAERDLLLRLAPHVIRPMRFVLPSYPGLRSALLLRLGLFIYDHLGGRTILPSTRTLDLTHHVVAMPLKRQFRFGFQYSDCRADDSRLVVLTALDAAERGATIRTRTKCVRAEREDIWRLVLSARGRREVVTARVLVNAAGPWAGLVAETVLRRPHPFRARLIKNSHIVVRRLFDHDCGYVLQNLDRRIVFALPYERDFTLIGATEEDFDADLTGVAPQPHEIIYLCKAASNYFRTIIAPQDVVCAYAGVRVLPGDGKDKLDDAARDHRLDLEEGFREAPLLTIHGGKITTYRKLAEEAVSRLSHFFVTGPAWTRRTPLPGGDFPYDGINALVERTLSIWPFLAADHARRLVLAYGTRVERILGQAQRFEDLGGCFGADLTAAELRYLMEHEWAQDADDVLWRRSKLGLFFSTEERAALSRFMSKTYGLNAAE